MFKRHIHHHKKSTTSSRWLSTKPLNHHPCTSDRWLQAFQEPRRQKALALRSLRIQTQMVLARLLLESVLSLDLPSRLASHRRELAR